MQEVIDWIDKEVARLDREMKGEVAESDGQGPAPELLKVALSDC